MALKPSSVGSALLLGTLLIGCGTSTSTPSDTTAPTVTLTATPNPVTADGNVTLKADARDETGVTRVEFFEGSTKVSEDTAAPFEFVTSVNALNNGKRTYTATAYDAAGNKASGSAEVTVAITANTAPSGARSWTRTSARPSRAAPSPSRAPARCWAPSRPERTAPSPSAA
ncbi:Ig-like domain-containing protein [Deinococcus aquaticus]|uniref:Ig-like domain-containing protein n=1 Tax=Deinococcus aquaticus TaxID=328692 RepID=UPI00360E4605